MARLSRSERLARRYPMLAHIPEAERPGLVRAAIRHPLLLVPLLGGGLLMLPPYLDMMFRLLNVPGEESPVFFLAKMAGIILLPIALLVPLLTRYVMPYLLRKELTKRGYDPSGPDAGNETTQR